MLGSISRFGTKLEDSHLNYTHLNSYENILKDELASRQS